MNDLFFRSKINFADLINKREEFFIILIMGGSAGCNNLLGDNQIMSTLLEKKICHKKKKIKILNSCVQGHTILAQTINYLMFSEVLNPEIVISYTGVTDINRCFNNDKILLEKYKINFETINLAWAAHIHESNENIDHYSNEKVFKYSEDIICDIFIERLTQIENIIGQSFYFTFSPTILDKKILNYAEKKILEDEKKKQKNISIIKTCYNILDKKLRMKKNYINLLKEFENLNEYEQHFKAFDKTSEKGEIIITNCIAKVIAQNNEICKK